jgi:hypothetical protein
VTAATDLLARIAALHPSDRQWLFAQTSAEMRARLAVELESAQSVKPAALNPRDVIASATPEHITRMLRTQPAWLAAVLLRVEDWPWSAAVLKRMPALQRATVSHPKPALAAAILRSLARSLVLIEAPRAAPSAPPFETLLQRFRSSRGER